jgi:hypothetical protein
MQPTQIPQMQAQPMGQMPPQNQPQMDMPVQDIRFVTSEEAKAFIVMPNTRVLLIDRNGGVAHLKTADSMGQSATQMYRFEPITQDGGATPAQPKIDLGAYIKREEIDGLGLVTIEQFNNLVDELNALKRSIQHPQQVNKPDGQKEGK